MQAETHAREGRGIWRSAGAIAAGLAAIVVLSLGVDQVMHSLGVYPPWGEPMNDTGLLLFAFAYRCVIQVGGCYLTARLAPHSPMAHALTLGGIGLVLASAGAAAMWNFGPNWYPVALVLSSLPCAWLGGLLHRGVHEN
jgi:hypothetical protein